MPDLSDLHARQNRYIDSLVANFQRELSAIVASTQARTQARLNDALSIADGRIARTRGNAAVLRKLDSIFLEELDRSGFRLLVKEFVAQFPGQLPFFQETLDILSASMQTPLPPIEWAPTDVRAFVAQAELASDGIVAAMESVAMRARNRAMLSIGGLKFPDLVASLAESTHRALPEVVGLAETATSTYYRVIADRGYRIIEAGTPGTLKYRFEGPFDKLTRPFCRKLLLTHRVYTRAQIDQMDNGQMPNVFITGGGWRCRHSFVMTV